MYTTIRDKIGASSDNYFAFCIKLMDYCTIFAQVNNIVLTLNIY